MITIHEFLEKIEIVVELTEKGQLAQEERTYSSYYLFRAWIPYPLPLKPNKPFYLIILSPTMTTTHDLLDQIDLAVELTEKGQLAQAEPIYISCLDSLSATLGDNHPDTISCTSNLGLLYMSQKMWSKALPWLIRCVEGKKCTLGSDHSSTLGSLTNLGIVHKNLRQYEDAEQCYNQALAGRTAQCGTDAPETLTVINNLATLYSEQQQYTKAQPLLSGDMTG